MRRLLAIAAALLTAALALSGCGEFRNQIQPTASQASAVSVQLDALPDVDHVGIEVAQNGDWLGRAGVDVRLAPAPSAGANPLSAVEAGRTDVAIVSEPELMLARSDGATVIGIGALTQRPLVSLIAVGSAHVRSVAGLKGKTVGLTGNAAQRALFDTMLRHAGVTPSSVNTVDVGSDITGAMLSGRVKVSFGGGANADALALALRARHRRVVSIPVTSAGVPNYDELVFAVTETYFAEHVNLLRRFVQAVGRGTETLRSDPGAGVSALQRIDPSLSATLAGAELRATLPALAPADGEPYGWQDQREWNAFGRWMTDRGLIDGPRAWAAASTNQLLAGQGP